MKQQEYRSPNNYALAVNCCSCAKMEDPGRATKNSKVM